MAASRKRPFAYWLPIVGLGAFLAWQALDVHRYTVIESRPPAWDQANHLDIALDYRRAIASGRWSDVFFYRPKQGIPPFPPGYHLLVSLLVGGRNPAWAALWANWPYLALLVVFAAGLMKELDTQASATAGALLLAAAPQIQYLLHTQLLDLAVVSLVAGGYWAFFRSRDFTSRAGSLAFAGMFALGMLHKWSFFAYFLPPLYFLGAALGKPKARKNAWTAVVLILVLAAPWYVVRVPLVASRLLEAAADQAIPFWKQGQVLRYWWESVSWLGPPVALLGWTLLVARSLRPGRTRVFVLWALSSYVFWTIVPNRQMRYLMPGLVPVILLAATAPRAVVWPLVAFQLFSAGNYTHAWLTERAVHVAGREIECWISAPPRREDWHLEDVVQEIGASKEGDVVPTVVLISDHERFNELNLRWTANLLRIPIRVRSTKSSFWETARFVLAKSGDVGPNWEAEQLSRSAAEVLRPHGWFAGAFRERTRWRLPDGSDAVLFERRKFAQPSSASSIRLARFRSGSIDATDVRIALGHWDARKTYYETARISAAEARIRGIPVYKPTILLKGCQLAADPIQGFRVLDARQVELISAEIRAVDLSAAMRKRGLPVSSLEMRPSGATVTATVAKLSLAARIRLDDVPDGVSVDLDTVRSGPFAATLTGWSAARLGKISFPKGSTTIYLPFETIALPLEVPPPAFVDGALRFKRPPSSPL